MIDILNIEGLNKTYNGNDFLSINNLDISLSDGNIYGVLGSNGAGKTTLISIISGLIKSDSGSVVVDGLNIKNKRKEVNRIIGLVPQEIALFGSLTAYENLDYFAAQYSIKKNDRKIIIDNYLKVIGLYEKRNELINSFSGGMKRRINLLAGILHNPKLLILDEPTVGTDIQSKNTILELLVKLKNDGMTIVYTSHLMEEAERICDKIYILREGKIIEEGSPLALVKRFDDASSLEEVLLKITMNKK